MKGKGERGDSDRGPGEKGKGQGVFWLNSLLLPCESEPRQKKGGARFVQEGRPVGGVPAGDLGHGCGREMGQNGEETEGISFPCSPWVEAAWGGGSAARFGRRRELMVAARLEAVVEQRGAIEVWLRGEERRGTAGLHL
jgi:hypothetical protein